MIGKEIPPLAPRMRLRFPRDWWNCHRWYYVSGRGDFGFCHNRRELREAVQRLKAVGAEVAYFKIKPKGWEP